MARTKATQHQMEAGGTTDERQGVNPCGHFVEHLTGITKEVEEIAVTLTEWTDDNRSGRLHAD